MNIIFHHPLPLNSDAKSASGIRPLKMLNAFKSLGLKVDIVSGYSQERKQAISNIKKKIQSGLKYAFVYSENSTMPTVLTDKHHLPLHPLLDFSFFNYCKKNNIPIGLFYRDIYWAFDNYGQGLNNFKIYGAKLSYIYELLHYKNSVTKLYLPSLEMGDYLPIIPKNILASLPPGHDANLEFNSEMLHNQKLINKNKLSIFYVGGMSNHYQMHILFNVINERKDIELTICTREDEWENVRSEYPIVAPNIHIIHEIGSKMREELLKADLASIFVKPQEYWEFAVPVKLFEYLGYHKPIITSTGTLAGKFVSDNNIGWSVDYDKHQLHNFFDEILKNPEKIQYLKRNIEKVSVKHTWQSRAQQVIQDLSK